MVPLASKVQAIVGMARPATKEKLQKFLGCINFYHRFVPHLVAILAPLHGLTSSVYGVQSDLVSDQGCQFVSALWRHLMVTLGISASSTTVYHPQLNGMVKRFHRTLKERLMVRQAGPDCMDHLSPVLKGLRASIREGSLTSPADLVSGAPFRLPGAMFELDSMVPPDLDLFVLSLHASLASLSPHSLSLIHI